VPEVAVQPGQEGSFVYMIDGGKAKIQPVKVSRQIGGEVVIAEGIKAGDLVLTEIPQAIAPGAEVQIIGAEGAGKGRDGKGRGEGKGSKSEKSGSKDGN
jgi:hypothetical protein